jgi:hypothetical protein
LPASPFELRVCASNGRLCVLINIANPLGDTGERDIWRPFKIAFAPFRPARRADRPQRCCRKPADLCALARPIATQSYLFLFKSADINICSVGQGLERKNSQLLCLFQFPIQLYEPVVHNMRHGFSPESEKVNHTS